MLLPGAETLQILRTVFGGDCLSQTVIYQWVKRSKEGRESFEDDPRPGGPSTARNEEMIGELRKNILADLLQGDLVKAQK